MLIEKVKELDPLERLLYFIQERESIRLKKEAGEPWPWTDDEILRKYKFTNVRRMDDRVSRWLMDNWYRPYFDHPNMLVACTLARHFNLPAALGAIGFPRRWEPGAIKRTLRKMKSSGECVFNSAYMIRGTNGTEKVVATVDHVAQPLLDDPPILDRSSMQRSVESLVGRYGLGSFMAGQIVADLRWAIRGAWVDKTTWAPWGPGSCRGLCRLRQEAPRPVLDQGDFLDGLLEFMEEGIKRLPEKLPSRLEAIDWQNCLCEWDKYERALQGEGRPKQIYRHS